MARVGVAAEQVAKEHVIEVRPARLDDEVEVVRRQLTLVTGDDFHVTAGLLGSFPVAPAKVEPVWPALRKLATQLREEQPKHPIVTRYAGKEMGNYDMLRCRHITDQADRLVLYALGLIDLWPAVLLADDHLLKVTGERPGTERTWPFSWNPGE